MKPESLPRFGNALVFEASTAACLMASCNVALAQGANLADFISEPGYTNTTASKDGNDLCKRGSDAAARWFADQAIGKDLLADAHRLAGTTQSQLHLPTEAIYPHKEINLGTHYRCNATVRVDHVLSTDVTYYVTDLSNAAGSSLLRSFDMSSAPPTKASARTSDDTFQITYYQDGREETVSFREALRRYAVKMQAIAEEKRQEADRLASEANRLASVAQQERNNARISAENEAKRNHVTNITKQKINSAMFNWKKLPCEARGGTWGMTPEDYDVFNVLIDEILIGAATWQNVDAAITIYGPKCRFFVGQ